MEVDCIPYKATGYFSKIITDYLDGATEISPFYQYQPKIEAFEAAIKSKSNFSERQRKVLSTALSVQYKKDGIAIQKEALLSENIQALENSNAFTITTGHQLCLFTGPIYFIYKIICTIKLCRQLTEKYPKSQFIPIYWMASEDHDFAEINHFHFKEKRFEWNTSQTGAVGKMSLEGLEKVFKSFESSLTPYSSNSEELKQLFRDAYLKHSNLAAATRYIVHQLFKQYGLVIIDGDDCSLKTEFSAVMQEELLLESTATLVETQTKKLAEHYKVQVNPREINLFYLKDTIRERIVKNGDAYALADSSSKFSKDELLEELQNYPERFSPNVILRPLYQETILPNLAYIGGGGELAYWFQLKLVFEHFKTPMPILLLRNSALFLAEKQSKYFKQLQINVKELFLKAGVLKKSWVVKNSKKDLKLSAEQAEIKSLYTKLASKSKSVDSTLFDHVKALETKHQKDLKQLSEKFIRVVRKNEDETMHKIDFLKNSLFPKDGLQERSMNFSDLYLIYGNQLIEILMDEFEMPTKDFHVFFDKK
tara:strand:- start:5026 stop:6636 length:1611 start_codon:yes stop_codon:yes gene_type:complete